jgi:Domain of unknown function (DUF1825)
MTMTFFDSEVIKQEATQLFTDYKYLIELGVKYGKFDREGQKIYIDQMEAVLDRFEIFMKRFELSEDFMAKMAIEQFKTQLGLYQVTPEQMFRGMISTLKRMKSEIK